MASAALIYGLVDGDHFLAQTVPGTHAEEEDLLTGLRKAPSAAS
jgi:hypothetical protein